MITEGDQIKARLVFGSSYKSPYAVINIIEIMKTDGIQGVEKGSVIRIFYHDSYKERKVSI